MAVQSSLAVLLEIQELLLRDYKTIQGFLKQVLLTTNELIGSDIGFIGLVEVEAGERYIVVRDKQENIIGAKTGEWDLYLGRHRIGGHELSQNDRSSTGYVAYTMKARRVGNVRNDKFYRPSNENTQSELAVPISLDGELLGVINLESKIRNFFTADHERILRLVARIIAQPLHSRMTRVGLRGSFKPLLDSIRTNMDSVPFGVSFDALTLNNVAHSIGHALNSGSCTIWLLNKTRTSLVLRGAWGPHKRYVNRHTEKRREPLTLSWRAMNEGLLFRCGPNFQRPQASARFDRAVYGRALDTPLMIAPLLNHGEAMGVIKVGLKHKRHDNPQGNYSFIDEQTLQIAQGEIAAALRTKELERQRRAQAFRQSRNVSFLHEILGEKDLTETLKKAVRKIPRLCSGTSCSIFLWHDARNEFVLHASNGLRQELVGKASYRRGEGLTGWVGEHGKCLNLTSHAPAYLHRIDPTLSWKGKFIEGTRRDSTRPFLAAPIFGDGKIVGIIRIGDRKGIGPFSESEEHMVAMVANHISLAIAFRNRYQDRLRLLWALQNLQARLNDCLSKLDFGIDVFRDSVLSEAAIAAAELLQADVLTLYPFRSDVQEFETPPVMKGKIRHPIFMKTPIHPDDVPWEIMQMGSQYWENVQDVKMLVGKVPARDGLRARPRFAMREGIVSAAGVKLEVGSRPVGILFFSFRQKQLFDAEKNEMIGMFARQIALLIEIARLYKEGKDSVASETAKYFALELHDAVLQTLTSAVMTRAGTAKDRLRNGDYISLEQDLNLLEKATKHCVEESRAIMESLGAPVLDRVGLIGALQQYRDDVWSPWGLQVEIPDTPDQRHQVPVNIQRHLYRIAQTAIGNVMNWAQAKHVRIGLQLEPDRVRMTIADDGIGFDADAALRSEGGLGLRGICKRAADLSGQVEINSKTGQGTRISVTIPMPGSVHGQDPANP